MNTPDIRAIIGLGNPGSRFEHNRHNIGFRILDALADHQNVVWQSKPDMQLTEVRLDNKKVYLIKPQTFMNSSGKVIPFLLKQGVKPENILVVHDELEKPFGKISIKQSGSARGHNGLRSIISICGPDFWRLRFGIGRPEHKDMVGDYVLQNFTEPEAEVEQLVQDSVQKIEDLFVNQDK